MTLSLFVSATYDRARARARAHTHTHTHTRSHTLSLSHTHTHTRARTHTHTYTHMHARTRAHTHSQTRSARCPEDQRERSEHKWRKDQRRCWGRRHPDDTITPRLDTWQRRSCPRMWIRKKNSESCLSSPLFLYVCSNGECSFPCPPSLAWSPLLTVSNGDTDWPSCSCCLLVA